VLVHHARIDDLVVPHNCNRRHGLEVHTQIGVGVVFFTFPALVGDLAFTVHPELGDAGQLENRTDGNQKTLDAGVHRNINSRFYVLVLAHAWSTPSSSSDFGRMC